MEWVETTGRTVEDAKEAALDQLGVDESDAEFVIVAEPRPGLFGRMRGEARVRARVMPTAPRPKRGRNRRQGPEQRRSRRGRSGAGASGGGGDGGGDEAVESAQGSVAVADDEDGTLDEDRDTQAGASANGSGGQSRTRGGSGSGGDGRGEGGGQAGSGQRRRSRGRRGRGGGGGGGGQGSGGEASGSRPGGQGSRAGVDSGFEPAGDDVGETSSGGRRRSSGGGRSPAAEAGKEEAVGEVLSLEEQGEAAREFIAGLIRELGLGADVSVKMVDDETAEVSVEGGELGILIGPGGATLGALQELARTVVQKRTGGHSERILVDVAGYRARRAEALQRFTRQVADEVRSSGSERALEPMSASDRKVVHDTVNEIEGVATRSEGEDPRRYIVISPTGGSGSEAADA